MKELNGQVTFGGFEQRLEDCLIERAGNDRVALTHQAIANDVGSSREVVSLQLKEFERGAGFASAAPGSSSSIPGDRPAPEVTKSPRRWITADIRRDVRAQPTPMGRKS